MNLLPGLKHLRRRLRIGPVRRHVRLQLARIWRRVNSRVTAIAITGSCGKTTATALLGQILGRQDATEVGLRFNTIKDVPKTILRTGRRHRWLVQEVSAAAPGVIAGVVSVLHPDVGIVTMIGSDHIRQFGSPEAIANEKAGIVRALPAAGLAVLNADDPLVLAMREQTLARVVTFGLSETADLRASSVSATWPDRLSLTVVWQGRSRPIQTRLVGAYWIVSILAALACALRLGVPLEEAVAVIEAFEPLDYRASQHQIEGGPIFIDDSNKAPFASIGVTLDFLAAARAPRKTLVLGNLADYRGASSAKYRKVARIALASGARVVGVGANAGAIRKLRPDFPEGMVMSFATAREARDYLVADATPGELILLKSAASGHIERILLNWSTTEDRCWVEGCGLKHCRACKYLSDPNAFRHSRERPGPAP